MQPPSSQGATSPATEIPQTRDRVATQSAQERRTPSESLLRYALEEGRPTVAGWRSPKTRSAGHTWLWVLGAGSLLVGLTVRLLFGP